MKPELQNVLILLAIFVPLFFLCAWISEKLKLKYQEVIAAMFAVLLIVSGMYFLCTGHTGYAWGVAPVPKWGEVVFVIGGIIILIMLITHWRKEKKTQNFDHKTKLRDSQDNSTTNASTDDSNDNSPGMK